MSASDERGPRKVIVGTSMFAMWDEYPGLDRRLEELGGLIDDMAKQSQQRYGRSLDVAALPEVAVSGGLPLGPKGAFPLEGKVQEVFAGKAREHHCYVVVPMLLKEKDGRTTNAAVLLDRKGALAGVYRKVHLVPDADRDLLEGGCAPGKGFPVFACDFGKVGLQICWDICFDDGWETLARKGAELVIWPSQCPAQIKPAAHALAGGYFILSSTWRNNASLIDPTGHVIRSITKPQERVFVEEIDLEYRLLQWQPALRNGDALREKYGDRVGFRYSEAEDEGIFWSNDPALPIARMVREMGLMTSPEELARGRRLQDKARGGPPSRR